MQTTLKKISDTKVELVITADQALLDGVKKQVLTRLSRSGVKLQGFREGKAPLALVEKQLDQNILQSEFLETAVNELFVGAVNQQKLRPAAQPEVSINKFVPFTTLEVTITVEAVGEIKLANYKKIRLPKKQVNVTAKDVEQVLDSLQSRGATYTEVNRAAVLGDQVGIDFDGTDPKTHKAIVGASGKEYPLVLGSNSFIPGFETEVVGLKAGDKKTFDIVFPEDYGNVELQGKKVTFAITANKVEEAKMPKLDDAFAATIGPFKTLAELKVDIKKQLIIEEERKAQIDYENELLQKIAEGSQVAIPDAMVDEELDRLENQERQDLMYKGKTWQEHLEDEGISEEKHRAKNRPPAELRVKAGLVLAEVAEQENLTVTPDEVAVRVQLLKGQYQDPKMQAELDNPQNQRDIASRILSEKSIAKLVAYASGE